MEPRFGAFGFSSGWLPGRPWPVGLWGPGPCFAPAWALFQPFEKKLAPQKMARGRGAGRRHFGGKTPRVRVVCTPSSPAAAAAPVEEAAPATATVQQALSPQKRQWNGSDLTLGGICKRCCRLITAYNKAREELEQLEAAAADDDAKLQEAQQMVAAKLAAVKDCEAQIKRGYFQEFNPDTAMASRRKSKKRKSGPLHNTGATDESATEGGAASSAGLGAPSAAAARGSGRGGSGGGLTFG